MGAEMTETTARLFADPAPRLPDWYYCSFRHGNRRFVSRRVDLIYLAERDGIPQVAPILLAFSGRPDEVRARIGKGLWKRVHHSCLKSNISRAIAKITTRLDFATIMEIPESALRETVGQCKSSGESAVTVAARIAKTRAEMREAVMLARDTARMGGSPNPKWSLRRLREEHDRLARDLALKDADPTPWADPWEWCHDGFRFRRLVSNADFAAEGRVMRHCIAGYASRARRGDETAFAITGDERASASFDRGGHIEIKGRHNRLVSTRCHRSAIAMWAAFNARGAG
jgi:hypothetical protein